MQSLVGRNKNFAKIINDVYLYEMRNKTLHDHMSLLLQFCVVRINNDKSENVFLC